MIYKVLAPSKTVVGNGISEPSTVSPSGLEGKKSDSALKDDGKKPKFESCEFFLRNFRFRATSFRDASWSRVLRNWPILLNLVLNRLDKTSG